MARSTDLHLVVVSLLAASGIGCSDLPSKSDALEIVQHEPQEDASCVVPIGILSRLKMEYATKAICVPRAEGVAPPNAPKDPALTCLEALAAAGTTKRMPGSYMAEWPDAVSGAGFDTISPYERRARDLLFVACFEMGDLREGRFRCGQARADKVIRVTKVGEEKDKRALVRYSRALTIDPSLTGIEAACGPCTRPPIEATVTLEKTDKQWTIAREGAAPNDSSSPAPASSAQPR